MRRISFLLFITLASVGLTAQADSTSAQQLADKYFSIANNIDVTFDRLSPGDGEKFYNRKITYKGEQIACASCHTANPAATGKHKVTGKPIKPLAPAANSERFTDIDKVEKNFEKHCLEVIGRDCTAAEKGNFMAYLISIKLPPAK